MLLLDLAGYFLLLLLHLLNLLRVRLIDSLNEVIKLGMDFILHKEGKLFLQHLLNLYFTETLCWSRPSSAEVPVRLSVWNVIRLDFILHLRVVIVQWRQSSATLRFLTNSIFQFDDFGPQLINFLVHFGSLIMPLYQLLLFICLHPTVQIRVFECQLPYVILVNSWNSCFFFSVA